MKVHVLFDDSGKIHALFQPSQEANAPQFRFRPAAGHRAEILEVPAEFRPLEAGQLHSALSVSVNDGVPRLVGSQRP